MKLRHLLLLAGGVAAASHAYALSIGSPRGNVYLGAAVDLSFPVQPDPGQTVDSSCMRAEVWMGETALLGKDVMLDVQATAVRVRTTAPVYEPLVTLKLTAGCTGAMTRSYTLFADPPATMAAAVAPIDLQQLQVRVPAPSLPPVATASASRAAAPQLASAVKRSRPSKRPINPQAIIAAAQPAEAADETEAPSSPLSAPDSQVAPTPAVEQPRLRIEPIEGLEPADTALTTAPSTLDGAALLDALQEVQIQQLTQESDARLAAMEEQLQALQLQLTTNRTEISGLHNQLVQAQNAPLPTWIYALLAMLALALATIAWLLQRVKQERLNAKHTWADTVLAVDESGQADIAPVAASPTRTTLPVTRTPEHTAVTEPLTPQAFAATTAAAPANTAPAIVAATPATAAMPSNTATSMDLPVAAVGVIAAATATGAAAPHPTSTAALDEVLTAQAMFDVQEQAEFYASIGENDHAIDILQTHIAQHESSSPLAYIELLQLLHRLSRTDAFAHARKKFQAYFNVNVPSFFEFAQKGQDLATGYPDVLRQIEQHWNSDELPAFLRSLLVCAPSVPETPERARFDLAAFGDVLGLYNIAQTTSAAQRGPLPLSANTTSLHSAAPVLATAALPTLATPMAPETGNATLTLQAADLDMLSTSPTDFSQASAAPASDSPYQTASHFKPDESLFDGLTLDWDSTATSATPAAAPAATAQVPDPLALPSLDAQLQAFLEDEKPATPTQSPPPGA